MGSDGKEEFDKAVDHFWKAAVGGALVAAPGTSLVALGASTGATLAYLCAAIVVLGFVALHQRRALPR